MITLLNDLTWLGPAANDKHQPEARPL